MHGGDLRRAPGGRGFPNGRGRQGARRGVGKTRPLFSTTGREHSDNHASDEMYLPRSWTISSFSDGRLCAGANAQDGTVDLNANLRHQHSECNVQSRHCGVVLSRCAGSRRRTGTDRSRIPESSREALPQLIRTDPSPRAMSPAAAHETGARDNEESERPPSGR